MKLKINFKYLLVCYLVYISSACSHQQVPVQTIFSSNDCAIREQVIKPINSAIELDEFFQSMPRTFSRAPITIPDIDHDKQTIVLFALGQKPTSGYSIELYKDAATIKNQTLYLPVRIRHPDVGRMLAQIITSPCQLYVLPYTVFSEITVEAEVAE